MLLLCAKALCCTTFRVACILLAVSGSCPLSCSSWQLPSSFRRPGASQRHFHLSSAPFHFTFSFFSSGIGYSVYKFQNPIAQKMSNNSRQSAPVGCSAVTHPLSPFPSHNHVLILCQGRTILLRQLFQTSELSHTCYGKY